MKDVRNAIDHLKNHQKYPATKEEIMETCTNLSDFSDEDKEWMENNLPDGTYDSADDVIQTLGLQERRERAY